MPENRGWDTASFTDDKKYFHYRLRNPDEFVKGSLRFVELGKGIYSDMGKLKSDPKGGMVKQNLMFDKKKWSVEDAKKHVKNNPDLRKELFDVKANELTEIHITKVAHAGNPAHTENDNGKKLGLTGAKFLKLQKDFDSDPYKFIDTLNKEGFVIKDGSMEAEIYEKSMVEIEKDYYSQSGSINSNDGKKYISWSCQSSEDDPSNWIMHLQDENGKPTGVTTHMGVTKDNTSNIQTLFFDKEKFNDNQVNEWISKNSTRLGDPDMPITKEELGALITNSMQQEFKPIVERIDALEKKSTPPPTTDQLQKDRDNLIKDISDIMKSVVPETVKPLMDRVSKLEGTIVGSNTNLSKGDEPDENPDVIKENETHQIIQEHTWHTPFLAQGDKRLVKKNKIVAPRKSTLELASALETVLSTRN